jgi:hypothetical protein
MQLQLAAAAGMQLHVAGWKLLLHSTAQHGISSSSKVQATVLRM